MKHRPLAWALRLGMLVWLGACSTPKDEPDPAEACPPGNVVTDHQPVPQAQVSADVLGPNWQKAPAVSHGKFPSGIDTHYRVTPAQEPLPGVYQLELRFSNVQGQPAIAQVYGFDGARIRSAEKTLHLLQAGKINAIRLLVNANPQGSGGWAVLTCQNKKKSVIAIDAPAP